jgi:AcrR family transcriptional regulator
VQGTRDEALRSDARRNRDRIVSAAGEALAEQGLDVGVDEIARRAGVGMGTLYRRFPTKELLIQAIFEERLDELAPAVEHALASEDAWKGFVDLLEAAVAAQAKDHGFLQLLLLRFGAEALPPGGQERFYGPFATLLERAHDAGQVRADVTADDLPVLVRMAAAAILPRVDRRPTRDWPRYVELLLDGLRPGAPHPR